MLSEIVENGKQLTCHEIAKEICIAAPLAVQALLASATDAVTQDFFAFQNMDSYLKPLFVSEDAQEVRAMLEETLPTV